MNITLYLRYATRCYSTDRMEWDVELSDEQYKQFLKARKERQEEFDDILEGLEDDETLEDNEEAMNEYMLLNYEILEELFPDWCYQQKEEFIEDAKSYDEDNSCNENLTADNVEVDGFYIDEEDEEEDEEDFFYDDEYDFDIDDIKKNGIQVNLTYSMSFGKGDGGDEVDWEETMSYKELKTYLKYRKEHASGEHSFDDMEEALPEWTDNICNDIYINETEIYRDNMEPDDDDYDEVMADDWSISEIANLYVRFVSFGEGNWD